ncbi:MAG TPA: N-acetyltransferase [Ktedonobacteraceae bacterium]|nr:N-acetyltransferase [Ktedonobacteraceae bacterium]
MAENLKSDNASIAASTFRLATVDDIALINELDSFSTSPARDIHREIEKYFGSVDPSTHERTLIFLADVEHRTVAKSELMLPPQETAGAIGYIKRVVVHPDFRGRGLARQLIHHLIAYARNELHLAALDLHVWEGNQPAVRLYESLGFELQHRELYFRLRL